MELSKLAKIFKALSCEQRLKLLKMIYELEKLELKNDSCCFGVEKIIQAAMGENTIQ